MTIKAAPLGAFAANFYLVTDEKTNEAFAVDPGAQPEIAAQLIRESKANLRYIFITHAHADHIGALDSIKSEFGAMVVTGKYDAAALNDDALNLCQSFGISSPQTRADILAEDGDKLPFGSGEIKIIHTPGHTRGSICILTEEFLISGDTLFEMSVGRTDFPGGSSDELISSIREKLFTLDGSLKVYPGHGNPTTIEFERNNNPFV